VPVVYAASFTDDNSASGFIYSSGKTLTHGFALNKYTDYRFYPLVF